MKVIPLSYTQVNWVDYMKLANEIVGRSPTRSLDSAHIRPGDPFSYLSTLVELRLPGTSPRDAVRKATDLLQHVSFSFLVHVDDYEYSQLGNIPLLLISSIEGEAKHRQNPDQLLVVSGTLLDWQVVVPMMIDASHIHKTLFSLVYVLFKQMNLRELFDKYTEVTTDDGLYRLEQR